MAFPSFKNRDKAIEDDLLKQLAAMDYNEEESDSISEYSEYGKDILKQLEIDENKATFDAPLDPEFNFDNLHNKI